MSAMRRTLLPLLAVLFLALPSCGKSAPDPWAAGFANKICPVQGSAVVTDDPALALEYEGHKIGFCCAGCPQEFRKNPTKFMDLMRKEPAKYGYRD